MLLHKLISGHHEVSQISNRTDRISALCTISESMRVVLSNRSPMVGCSIGVTHKKIPVVGVISQPFLNRIVSC